MPTIPKAPRRPWQPEYEPHKRRIHTNTKFYASSAWRRLRAVKITRDPICELCAAMGKTTPAQVIDHITPINQGGEPLDMENLMSLCNPCHNRKSGQEAHTRNKTRENR